MTKRPNTAKARHFLSLMDCSGEELRELLTRAGELKKLQYAGRCPQPLSGKTVALLFEQPSTRTRVSFEVGAQQLGASCVYLGADTTQISRGETPEDTARVLSRMVDLLVVRARRHQSLERMAAVSQVPVINALTEQEHPCQLLADLQTYCEHRGDIRGRRVALIGDGKNNVCRSYVRASQLLDFELRIACPPGAEPQELPENAQIHVFTDPLQAARDADLLVTDVWTSMGQEHQNDQRQQLFDGYSLNRELLQLAAPQALYMHCLPAYRGKEISTELLEAPDTVIWEEAENRLHSQKALLEFLLS